VLKYEEIKTQILFKQIQTILHHYYPQFIPANKIITAYRALPNALDSTIDADINRILLDPKVYHLDWVDVKIGDGKERIYYAPQIAPQSGKNNKKAWMVTEGK